LGKGKSIYEHIFVLRFLPSNEVFGKKHMDFIAVSHQYSSQTLRMLTAHWSQEQMCSDK
jgi:hypothetical protein